MNLNINIDTCLSNLILVCQPLEFPLIEVPGFAPKRIYLENVPDRKKSSSSSSSSSSSDGQAQSKKGFLGVKWGFESGDKK